MNNEDHSASPTNAATEYWSASNFKSGIERLQKLFEFDTKMTAVPSKTLSNIERGKQA